MDTHDFAIRRETEAAKVLLAGLKEAFGEEDVGASRRRH